MAEDHGPSVKNDEQYESLREQGESKEKAARIANANEQGGGNPASERGGKGESYEDRTVEELHERASEIGIDGHSDMNKDELIDALRSH